MTGVQAHELGFGILFDVIRDAVIVADVETERITLLNAAAAAMFGYEQDDAVGLPLEVIVPPELRTAHHTGIALYRQTRRGALVDGEAAVSVPALRRDGTRITIELRLSPIMGVFDGRYVMALIRDVTERDTLAQELAEASLNLELALQTEQDASRHYARLVELKDDFLTMLSHDLGSPLTAIAGYADLLDRSWERLALTQRREALRAIQRATNRMTALVRDVLDAARLDAGAMSFQPQEFDMTAALRDAIGELGPDAVSRVRVDGSGPNRTVWADPARHAQIASNLLGNALKFSPPGSPVDVTVLALPDAVEVSVRDHGPGIPAAQHAHLFDRFHRLHGEHSDVAGSGLGLYITRRLIHDQGGTLRVLDHPDGGAMFRYTLPNRGANE